jgi:hypothetical protein
MRKFHKPLVRPNDADVARPPSPSLVVDPNRPATVEILNQDRVFLMDGDGVGRYVGREGRLEGCCEGRLDGCDEGRAVG